MADRKERAARRFRTRGSRDPIGLSRAPADRLLPVLVAAMALLAALALAGARGAESLARRWQAGAQAAVTVQVPNPDPERMDRALAVLRAQPDVAQAEPVDPERLAELLRPWLGGTSALPLPGVIEVRLVDLSADAALLGDRVAAAVPGTVTEAHGIWVARLVGLARAVRAMALAVLALVAGVAAAVVAVATRAGLSARRDSILILHGLGARDGDIAGRFARRAGTLAAGGGAVGAIASVPALAALADLAAPFAGSEGGGAWTSLPWLDLMAVPLIALVIGWTTAQATVRLWLRQMP